MKNYFFINPAAGSGKKVEALVAEIESTAAELGLEYEILYTDATGDGEKKARLMAEALGSEEGRFYACGGDGTLGEIVNGIQGIPNAAVGVITIGTGNDTARNFPDAGDFMSVKAQLLGKDMPIDLLKYEGVIDGRQQSRYCINMFNIGFDCNVVELAGRLKQKPLIEGSMAYVMGIAGNLIKRKGADVVIKSGGETLWEGDILQCAICNGSFCGGGIHSTPQAAIDDGVMDMLVVNYVSRLNFIKLFPKYKDGTYYGNPKYDNIIKSYKLTEVSVEPHGSKDLFICVDGEIQLAEGIRVTMCHHAIRFIVPAKQDADGIAAPEAQDAE